MTSDPDPTPLAHGFRSGRRALLRSSLLLAAGALAPPWRAPAAAWPALPSARTSPQPPGGPAQRAAGAAPLPLLWLDDSGEPSAIADEALALLAAAASEGLDPDDYGSRELAALAADLRRAHPADQASAARFDAKLTESMLRYLRDLHAGRVAPQVLHMDVPKPAASPDYAGVLTTAVAGGRLRGATEALAPTAPAYRRLRNVLARYRALAADPTLPAMPPYERTLRPGDVHPAIPAMRQRLTAFGDLVEGTSPFNPAHYTLYTGALADAVRQFQRRHGLVVDGLIGKNTHAALAVSPAARVRQIELSMERLRWLPPLGEQPLIVVNIPMFRLWTRAPGEPALEMPVIVGKAMRTQTPVFVDEMRYLVFRPYWNVPRSIVRDEILPAVQRDRSYLARHDMELVEGGGDDAAVVSASDENLDRLQRGVLRLRQRPGPNNSLGLVKFIFPNDASVYLHGTPAKSLFERARRDFSHGCVRVEDPVALAEWVLRDQPQWTRETIVAAMNGAPNVRVDLATPVRVVLYYLTAAVMPSDGTLMFAEDLYGHDRRLAELLEARPRA